MKKCAIVLGTGLGEMLYEPAIALYDAGTLRGWGLAGVILFHQGESPRG